VDKFSELVYGFYHQGYSVFIYEQRGYGHSSRIGKDPRRAHTDDFMFFARDLNAFMEQVVKARHPDDIYLFAHSMGGAVAALYLKEYPDAVMFQAAHAKLFYRQRETGPALSDGDGSQSLRIIRLSITLTQKPASLLTLALLLLNSMQSRQGTPHATIKVSNFIGL
jgi:pimeloyl-ACP methyl ester carboxylesterase